MPHNIYISTPIFINSIDLPTICIMALVSDHDAKIEKVKSNIERLQKRQERTGKFDDSIPRLQEKLGKLQAQRPKIVALQEAKEARARDAPPEEQQALRAAAREQGRGVTAPTVRPQQADEERRERQRRFQETQQFLDENPEALQQAEPTPPQEFTRAFAEKQAEAQREKDFEEQKAEFAEEVAAAHRERLFQQQQFNREQEQAQKEVSSNAFGSTKTQQIEQRIDRQTERDKAFFESKRFERIEDTASLITGGKLKPIETRSFAGQALEKAATGLLAAPIAVGGAVPSAGAKVAAATESLINPETRASTKKALSRAKDEAKKVFDPKTPEGVATLGTAALFASPIAASRVAAGTGGFGTAKIRLAAKTSTIEVPKPVTVAKGGKFVAVTDTKSLPFKAPEKVTVKKTTVGLELPNLRSAPIASKTTVIPEPVTGKKVSTGVRLGAKTPERLKFSPEQEAQTFIPATNIETKGLVGTTFDVEPAQLANLQSKITIVRLGGKEKGINPKQVEFKVEGVKDTKTFTEEVVKFGKKDKRRTTLFGSGVGQRLREPFPKEVLGDVEFFINRPKAKVAPRVEKLAESLTKRGEKIRVSKADPEGLTLETARGKKVLEIKTPDSTAGEVAPTGFAGFPFGDARSGAGLKSVPFSKIRSITIGEQLARKASGATTLRGRAPEAGKGFEQSGFLGLGKRSVKDISDFLVTTKGVQDLVGRRVTGKGRAKRIGAESEKIVKRLKPEQRKTIREQITKTNPRLSVDFLGKSVGKSIRSPSVGRAFFKSPTVTPSARPIVSPSVKSPAKSISLSPKPLFSESPSFFKSPRTRSRSPSLSPSLSPRSPSLSPSLSPRSPSLSPSPSPRSPSLSPSPSPRSPSLSPSPSPRSPSLSPSPSPRSPSPSPSPSPSLSPSPSPSPNPFFSPRPSPSFVLRDLRLPSMFKGGGRNIFGKQPKGFAPTLFTAFTGLRGKETPIGAFSGLGLRPLPKKKTTKKKKKRKK